MTPDELLHYSEDIINNKQDNSSEEKQATSTGHYLKQRNAPKENSSKSRIDFLDVSVECLSTNQHLTIKPSESKVERIDVAPNILVPETVSVVPDSQPLNESKSASCQVNKYSFSVLDDLL